MRSPRLWPAWPACLACVACLAAAYPATAQVQRAPAPPLDPVWRSIDSDPGVELLPFVSFNDRDGVVTGAWVRWRPSAESDVWVAAGGGFRDPERTPTVFEVGAREAGVEAWFKLTEGRRGFGASYAFDLGDALAATVAAEEASLVDERYLPRILFFQCPGDAPAAPCDSVRAPLAWSADPDRAAEVRLGSLPAAGEIHWQVALRGAPSFLGADRAYLQARAEAVWQRTAGLRTLTLRFATGWTSADTPLQSRFFVHGAGPLERWTNPYLRSRGAPLDRIAYFDPGGAHLRAYGRTSVLVRRFAAFAATARRRLDLPLGLAGSAGAFAEVAWLPGAPGALGRAAITEEAAVLFDWAKLTAGEGEGGGKFSAGVLEIPSFLADAGFSASVRAPLGIEVEAHLPLWASAGELADRAHDLLDLRGEGEDRPLGLRGTLTVRLHPSGGAARGPSLEGF